MDVIFTKRDTTPEWSATGIVLSVQTFDCPARLPHDIAHIIVEKGLALWKRVSR
jgi:hypothetical protein